MDGLSRPGRESGQGGTCWNSSTRTGTALANLTPANEGDLGTELQVDCDRSDGIEVHRTAVSVAPSVVQAVIGGGIPVLQVRG
jgi:hypothetical protein